MRVSLPVYAAAERRMMEDVTGAGCSRAGRRPRAGSALEELLDQPGAESGSSHRDGEGDGVGLEHIHVIDPCVDLHPTAWPSHKKTQGMKLPVFTVVSSRPMVPYDTRMTFLIIIISKMSFLLAFFVI